MLVLTRKLNESLIINGNIKISVVEVKGRQVRLGIQAPPEVKINREEIHRSLQAQKNPSKTT